MSRAVSATGSERTRCTSIHRWDALGLPKAKLEGRKVRVGKRLMKNVGRASEKGETQGFMKIVVDADTDAILGAAILGVGGDEAIPRCFGRHGCQGAVHNPSACRANPSDGFRVDSDHARRTSALGECQRRVDSSHFLLVRGGRRARGQID
jgi:hypothetical protein